MSSSQVQKLLDKKDLDLQQISEQTGLCVESIQSFEQRVQEIVAELEKISNVLEMPPSEMLRISLEKSIPLKGIAELYCDLFPDSERCK